ncbi:MAG TPA: acyltransferase [Verrucomicrobiae bacterium]|nr:acyltransferase [Verrucomicrobiae bacterium]
MNSIRMLLLKFRYLLISLASGESKIRLLRKTGMKIGKDCQISAKNFSTEPFLIEIGDHVAIAAGTSFITHDGSVWILRESIPEIDVFGEIKVGNNTFIGSNSLILPGTRIGANCVIGAGSVVRGVIPDNSVAIGNPAKVVFKTSMLRELLLKNKHKLMTKKLGLREKREALLKHFNYQG